MFILNFHLKNNKHKALCKYANNAAIVTTISHLFNQSKISVFSYMNYEIIVTHISGMTNAANSARNK